MSLPDDRIFCGDCSDLASNGDCLAARTRRRTDVGERYGHADLDLPFRCIWFAPKRGAEDRRTGAERYPVLMAEYESANVERIKVRRQINERGIQRAKEALNDTT